MTHHMVRVLAVVAFSSIAGHCPLHSVAVTALAAPAEQIEKAAASATVAGTWDMTLMSHQAALVLEQDGTKLTGTMMMPGTDLKVLGTFIDGELKIVASMVPAGEAAAEPRRGMTFNIAGTLQDDGTLAGEVVQPNGSVKWTAERLKAPRKR